MNKKIKVFLLACVLAIICCMGFTVGATDEANAEVKGHSLTITDTGISVNFYVAIQGDVQVTLNENEVDLSTAEKKEVIIDAKAYDCYVFTQAVVAKEMDDKVTLSILSGNTELVNDSYCVNDYVAEVQKGGYNYNFETLANAMTYYGEFAEVYFGYKGATSASANANSYISDVTVANFESYAASVNTANMPDGLGFYGTMLNLNSKTTLRLLFTVEGKEPSSFGIFTANGKDLGELKPYREYYYVDIEGIGAAELDKAYTIKCGDAEIISNCSVLTYAGAAVKSTKESLVNLSKALYLYNQKADTYVGGQAYAVYDMFYGNDGFSATPGTRTPIYLTDKGDVTTQASGNTEITALSQLSGSRTKGYSVWMEKAYTVSGDESLTGPYVIRRYTGNNGNVLNVTGTATLKTTVDRSTGEFVAQYPSDKVEVTISELVASEVYVSGALNVTGSAKSGVITTSGANIIVNVDGLTAEGDIVFASHAGQSLTGNGDVSAITLLDDGDDHFDVVKHNNNVRIASVICVCGEDVTGKDSHSCPWTENVDNIAKVYDIAWQPHTATSGTVPGCSESGYYYLTNNLTASRSDVYAQSYLDLNGRTITTSATSYWTIRIFEEGASYSVTDSKEGGTMQFPENYTLAAGAFGSMVDVNKAGTFSFYGGTIDMSNAVDIAYNVIDVQAGTFFMHGGVLKPAQSKTTKRSNCIGARNSGTITVTEGTIYGDVVLENGNTLTVGGDAEVGVQLKGNGNYGIEAWATNNGTSLICDNLNENAKIVLRTKSYINLSRKTSSDTSLASVFTLVNEGKDGHYGVVKKSDGTLAFATTICACGKNVSDEHNHTCAWVETNGIANVYNIDWKAHTTDNGLMPGYNTTGYYYLATDITLTTRTDITSTNSHLDLNGKKVTCASTTTVNIRTNSTTARYAISDSKGEGAIQLSENFSSSTHGAVIQLYYSGSSFTMYSGTIDMTNGELNAGYRGPIELCGSTGNDFIMYGGVIKPTEDGRSFHTRNQGRISILGNGTVYGKLELSSTDVLTVGESANVGLQWADFDDYGIVGLSGSTRQIVCDNLNEKAQVVIKETANIALSETVNSDSVLTTIKAADGHYGVIKESDGLRFVSVICICGDDVTGEASHDNCPWAGVNGISAVYNIPWQAYTAESGYMPGCSASGYYYLTKNLSLTGQSDITVTSYLDLNGKTITLSDTTRNIALRTADIEYSIADSKGGGTIKASENYSYADGFGGVIWYSTAATLNMYGGTIDMTNIDNAPYVGEEYNLIDISAGATFAMHDGVIKPAKDGDCIGVRSANTSVRVMGGTIFGKVVLQNSTQTLSVGGDAKVGLPLENLTSNGIDAWYKGTKLISEDVTNKAKIIIISGNFDLSGTGELSAFTAPKDFEIIKTGDQLSMQVIGAE